jgi:hypothetical protein
MSRKLKIDHTKFTIQTRSSSWFEIQKNCSSRVVVNAAEKTIKDPLVEQMEGLRANTFGALMERTHK